MSHPCFKNALVPVEYLESNHDFCKQIIEAYENALDKNNSWYGPKIPFVISMPKLLNNAYAAKKVLRRKKPMKTLNVQKISRDELAEHWGQSLADTCFGRKSEMFIRSDRKGNINWDKAPVYTWAEILKERERRRVVFTVDPEIFELP